MDKNYRQYNKRASMDSIEVPDVDKIKKLSDKKFKGSGVNRTADEIFDLRCPYQAQGRGR